MYVCSMRCLRLHVHSIHGLLTPPPPLLSLGELGSKELLGVWASRVQDLQDRPSFTELQREKSLRVQAGLQQL